MVFYTGYFVFVSNDVTGSCYKMKQTCLENMVKPDIYFGRIVIRTVKTF